ncbi:MAG: hypothetical protein PVI50_03820 [Gammaproteobacteria bacterium]|jgi:hypothetical protein
MDDSMFRIDDVAADPRRLTQSVLQVTDLLGIYQAELTRVLGIHCGDVGQLASGRRCLEAGTPARRQARLFVRLYQALYARHRGDGAAMCRWLRVPHLLIVDDGRLADVVRCLEQTAGMPSGV